MTGNGSNNSDNPTRAGNAAPANTTDRRNENIADRFNPNERAPETTPGPRPDNSPDPLDPNRVGDAVVDNVQGQVIRNVVNNVTDGALGTTGSAIVSSVLTGLIEGRDFDQIATNFVIQQGTSMVMQGMISANVIAPLVSATGPLAGSFSVDLGSVGAGTISVDPLAIIGGLIVGSALSDLAETNGGAVGGQIGSVIGSVLIPIPVVGAMIGQIVGTLIGDALNRDGLAERHATINNNSSNPDDVLATTEFGTFGISDTHWFGEDINQGRDSFAEAIVAIDHTFAERLDLTPEQMAQAQANLANTNNTYDFGMEHTGWHPSNRIITDRYAAILDAVDPSLGDIVRFSDPDRSGGVQAVLSTALTLAAELDAGRAKPEDIAAIAELVQDNLFTDVYMQDPEVRNPSDAYDTEPAYLTEGRAEWEANEAAEADEYMEEVAERQDEILANADPEVVEQYEQYLSDFQEYQASYDSKTGGHQTPPPNPPDPEVIALYDELQSVAPPDPPLYVSNPIVPVYDSKGQLAGELPLGALSQAGIMGSVGTTGELSFRQEDVDPFAMVRPDAEIEYDSKGNAMPIIHSVLGGDDDGIDSMYSNIQEPENTVAENQSTSTVADHTVDAPPQHTEVAPEPTEAPPEDQHEQQHAQAPLDHSDADTLTPEEEEEARHHIAANNGHSYDTK